MEVVIDRLFATVKLHNSVEISCVVVTDESKTISSIHTAHALVFQKLKLQITATADINALNLDLFILVMLILLNFLFAKGVMAARRGGDIKRRDLINIFEAE